LRFGRLRVVRLRGREPPPANLGVPARRSRRSYRRYGRQSDSTCRVEPIFASLDSARGDHNRSSRRDSRASSVRRPVNTRPQPPFPEARTESVAVVFWRKGDGDTFQDISSGPRDGTSNAALLPLEATKRSSERPGGPKTASTWRVDSALRGQRGHEWAAPRPAVRLVTRGGRHVARLDANVLERERDSSALISPPACGSQRGSCRSWPAAGTCWRPGRSP
jgi:hypothetical protein